MGSCSWAHSRQDGGGSGKGLHPGIHAFPAPGRRPLPTPFCFLPAPCPRERTASTSLANPGILKASLLHSDLLLSDNQSLGEASRAALGSSPWCWLTHSGILTGGKNISLVFSAGCCHHLSFQDPVFMPRASAASPPIPTPQEMEHRPPIP